MFKKNRRSQVKGGGSPPKVLVDIKSGPHGRPQKKGVLGAPCEEKGFLFFVTQGPKQVSPFMGYINYRKRKGGA